MADAYAQLDSLRTMLGVRRQEAMEKMARGVEKDQTHHELVGRCKALKEVIEDVSKQIKSINGGDDDEQSTNGK